jgi:hypothetical protein
MPKYNYVVEIECSTKEQADEVMCERLGYDEDYGYPYKINNSNDCPTIEQCLLAYDQTIEFLDAGGLLQDYVLSLSKQKALLALHVSTYLRDMSEETRVSFHKGAYENLPIEFVDSEEVII